MGRHRVSGMLVCLGTFSGIEKVVSLLQQEQRDRGRLAALLLPEPQRVEIRILHHEAQADRLPGYPAKGLVRSRLGMSPFPEPGSPRERPSVALRGVHQAGGQRGSARQQNAYAGEGRWTSCGSFRRLALFLFSRDCETLLVVLTFFT